MDHETSDYFRNIIEKEIPFNKFLGIKVHSLDSGLCMLCLPFRQELIGDGSRKTLHGGVLSTLLTVCGSFAVWSMCSREDKLVTIDMGIDYLSPARCVDLVAESRVSHVGTRIGNAHTVIYPAGARDEVIAEGRSVYSILRSKA